MISHRVTVSPSTRILYLTRVAKEGVLQENVIDSGGTVVFMGSRDMAQVDYVTRMCVERGKPCICVSANNHHLVTNWIIKHKITDLHVCSVGDRPEEEIHEYMRAVFEKLGEYAENYDDRP